MDVDHDNAHAVSNVDDWLTRFSPATGSKPNAFPFTPHKTQNIESRRALMSDLLIFDVLLIRGGVRSPDIFFPPTDWASLRRLLDVIDQSTYDILKKDCLVYILLKWAWDVGAKETNPGWEVRYLQDRCIAPQFATLADAYWLLDTGTHLSKAVSILSDARLNRDYVSKILQALSLSCSFAEGTSPATAALVVKYVRSAKPLLTEPDDIDLYTLSLAQLSFMDAWAYQKSFPEGSITRERLLAKIIGWCVMPIPKQGPLAQFLASPLSPYEQAFLHSYALPSQLSTSASLSSLTSTPSKPVLSSQAMSILQDLLCVRAIQSGDYVSAIKLDHQFSSVSSPGGGTSASIALQGTPDRKSIIQDLFATLPPSERTLLEDEIGKVATGVRTDPIPRQNANASAPTRKPLVAELSLSASWEDVGASMEPPAPSTSLLSSSAVGASIMGKSAPDTVSATGKVSRPPLSTLASASPFASHVSRPTFGHQAPPTPKFTAFGSPIPPTASAGTHRGVITERAKTSFSSNAAGIPNAAAKPAAGVSLFDIAGSAKNAPNAFYKPPSGQATKTSIDETSALASSGTVKHAEQVASVAKQNGQTQGGDSDEEDVSMGSGSDVEIIGENRRGDELGEEEQEEDATHEDEEDAGDFLTYEKSGAADLTLHDKLYADEAMNEDHGDGLDLGFSVFSGRSAATQNGSVGRREKDLGWSGLASHASPPRRAHVSSSPEAGKALNTSVSSATGRSRAPPGAFHHEEDDADEDQHHEREGDSDSDEEDDRVSQPTPTHSPRRSARARRSQTPTRPSRSQPQRSSKTTTTTISGNSRPLTHSGRTSSRDLSRSIPGALMDEDNDDHRRDDVGHADAHGDEDAEMDEQEEDAIAPLPSRTSRRTRSSGLFGASTKSKASAKPTAPAATKGKAKARLPEVKTPARRSSRLSMASSTSPDHTELPSPTKRKSTGSRASIAGSGSGAVATRSSTRRKR